MATEGLGEILASEANPVEPWAGPRGGGLTGHVGLSACVVAPSCESKGELAVLAQRPSLSADAPAPACVNQRIPSCSLSPPATDFFTLWTSGAATSPWPSISETCLKIERMLVPMFFSFSFFLKFFSF